MYSRLLISVTVSVPKNRPVYRKLPLIDLCKIKSSRLSRVNCSVSATTFSIALSISSSNAWGKPRLSFSQAVQGWIWYPFFGLANQAQGLCKGPFAGCGHFHVVVLYCLCMCLSALYCCISISHPTSLAWLEKMRKSFLPFYFPSFFARAGDILTQESPKKLFGQNGPGDAVLSSKGAITISK